MKHHSRTIGLALALGLLGVLQTSSTAAEDAGPVYRARGTLDLIANGSGDRFTFTPTGAPSATATETFASNSQARLSESGDDLTTLTPTGPGSASQLYVGLKDHVFGVRAQGEGSGTPASQVNNSGTNGQALTIALGPATPGTHAWYAQFGLKFKFGATVRIQAYDGETAVGAPVTKTCAGSDCGPDSGNDRLLVTVGAGNETTLFTKVVISIASPTDGAVALLDDPAAGLDTYFDIVQEFDGELACDQSVTGADSTATGTFKRLNTSAVQVGCGTLKVYNLSVESGTVKFEPDTNVAAQYRGDLRFASPPTNPLNSVLQYDRDGGLNGETFVNMQWCGTVAGDPGGYFTDVLGGSFPTLSGLALEGGQPPTSCIVGFNTAAGGDERWVVYLEGDPFYKR